MSKPEHSDEWETPGWLWKLLDAEFAFSLDAAATLENTKRPCPIDGYDGLKENWQDDAVFVNPPYSNIKPWVEKAIAECRKGATVVMLLRVDPTTKYFKLCVQHATEIRLLSKRIRFEYQGKPADRVYNFPVCIVVFRPRNFQQGPAHIHVVDYNESVAK